MASPDSDLIVQLEAPNGVCYAQPVGLFINNEFVAAVSSETITTINPAYVKCLLMTIKMILGLTGSSETSRKSSPFIQQALRMLTMQYTPLVSPSMGLGGSFPLQPVVDYCFALLAW
ncbi:Aldehyde/histidinol dehydrogenase [Ilyonectria robusta]